MRTSQTGKKTIWMRAKKKADVGECLCDGSSLNAISAYLSFGYFKIIPLDVPSSWRRTDSARLSMKRLSSWAGRLKMCRHSRGEAWIGFQPTACSNLSKRKAD